METTKTKADAIMDWILFIFSYAIALIVLAVECTCAFVYALFKLILCALGELFDRSIEFYNLLYKAFIKEV